MLDGLEERIKLLVERYEDLAEEYRALVEMRERLKGTPDPVALQERLRALEAEHERHSRHEAFLEEGIRDLLARIRYVVEA
ncbi:hypothetical protein BH18GEM1_BH18GEM1_01000 [soil metagenome]